MKNLFRKLVNFKSLVNASPFSLINSKFIKVGEDDNGYPITKVENGEPILDEVKMYELPYLKNEVDSLMIWLKDNR